MDYFDVNSLDVKDDELFDMDLHRASDFLVSQLANIADIIIILILLVVTCLTE